MIHSNAPMILNVIGKNYQAIGEYEKAEKFLLRSTHRLPGRIYPYYLLAKLYAAPDYRHEEKLKRAIEVVLTAIKEMRKEMEKLIVDYNKLNSNLKKEVEAK